MVKIVVSDIIAHHVDLDVGDERGKLFYVRIAPGKKGKLLFSRLANESDEALTARVREKLREALHEREEVRRFCSTSLHRSVIILTTVSSISLLVADS